LLLLAVASCGAPPAAPTRGPSNTAPPAPANPNLELVARCATEAAQTLGWNPVPDGAHRGSVIATALEYGGAPACAALVGKENASSFQVGADKIDWDWGPKDDPEATTIRYQFSCAGCTPIETTVTLPRRWHCFSWLERQHHGTVCLPDHAACERERSRFPTKTECALRTGAAWCRVGTQSCSSDPWSCANAPVPVTCERRS
jgi:hypothetical protein